MQFLPRRYCYSGKQRIGEFNRLSNENEGLADKMNTGVAGRPYVRGFNRYY